jgi:hypothetical protein
LHYIPCKWLANGLLAQYEGEFQMKSVGLTPALLAFILQFTSPVTVFAGGGSGSGDGDIPFALTQQPSGGMDLFDRALQIFEQGTFPKLAEADQKGPIRGRALGGFGIVRVGTPDEPETLTVHEPGMAVGYVEFGGLGSLARASFVDLHRSEEGYVRQAHWARALSSLNSQCDICPKNLKKRNNSLIMKLNSGFEWELRGYNDDVIAIQRPTKSGQCQRERILPSQNVCEIIYYHRSEPFQTND